MGSWLLLAATLFAAWMTYDAFQLDSSMDEPKFKYLPSIWKQGMEHLTLAEQDELQQRSRVHLGFFGPGLLPWLFLAITVLLAVGTAKSFSLWP